MSKLKNLSFSLLLLGLISCKKEAVDGSTQQNFQQSVNEMASDLSTIKQYKFNEALYVIKTFGVSAKGEMEKMKELAHLLEGKKTQDIFAMADQLAQQNNYDWSSNGTPSMGDMNIFQNLTATEFDPNDVKAESLNIDISPRGGATTDVATGIHILPYLVDAKNEKVIFDKAGLQCTYEVFSNGVQIYKSRGIIMENTYAGITLPYNKLNKKNIVDNKIDVRVSIETTKKTHRFLKTGILVNPNALYVATENTSEPKANPIADTVSVYQPKANTDAATINTNTAATAPNTDAVAETPKATLAPKAQLSLFLNNLSSKNFKSAFEKSQNTNWGSYENFANTNSGFGAIQNLEVKSIKALNEDDQLAQYEAEYVVTDKNGNQAKVKSQYDLKLIKNQWKITNYKIISSQ